MAFVLGRGSAVEWLRLNHKTELLQSTYELSYADLEGSRRQFERHVAGTLKSLTKPVQLVVGQAGFRRRTAVTNCFMFNIEGGKYPCNYIKKMLFCSTPELTFVQMASVLDEEKLRFLGMELCGRFGIDGDVFLRPQTTTPTMLAIQAQSLRRVHGRSKAIEVAPLVIGGAASPMEIALTLILCAARDQGGYGLSAPELNHKLPVPDHLRTMWDDDHITPDMLWDDAHLVVEYDSELHHTAASRIANDALRRNLLEEMGYRVITVTSQHLRTPRQIDQIAQTIAKRLGMALELGDWEEQARRHEFQSRMRYLGAHPEDLVAISPLAKEPKRNWNPRR